MPYQLEIWAHWGNFGPGWGNFGPGQHKMITAGPYAMVRSAFFLCGSHRGPRPEIRQLEPYNTQVKVTLAAFVVGQSYPISESYPRLRLDIHVQGEYGASQT